MPLLSVEKLVGHLKTKTTKVHAKRLYSYMKGSSHEMGVTIRVIEQDQKPAYYIFHLHYNTKHKGDDPDISAHFKAGHRKTDPQGFDLPKHDAYAMYIELQIVFSENKVRNLYPVNKQSKDPADKKNWENVDNEPWSRWNHNRITRGKIQTLISNKDTRLLKTACVSKLYDLAFWDQDAWSLMMDYVTGCAA